MGQYLACGIATKITILKKYSKDNDNILERIEKKIDLNLYNQIDYDDSIVLEIKRDIFEENVINFIIEQAEDFFETDKDYTIRQLDTLKGLKYDDLINVSKEKRISSFHFFDGYSYICNDINYIDKQCKDIYCDIISFICDGKVFFESCYDIFTYLRNRIIKSSNNPIRTATVVTMIG